MSEPTTPSAPAAQPADSAAAAGAAPAAEPAPLIDVPILAVTVGRQRQHGLRHSDYRRYRQYCSRMIRSARCATRLTSDPRKPSKKQLTPQTLSSARQLDIGLGLVERAWAYAMEDKQHIKEEPRKHFHAVARLSKATRHATQLYELIVNSKRCTPRTEQEALAYKLWIEGVQAFERKQWERCAKAFAEAKNIYTSLMESIKDGEEKAVYSERCEEISGSLSFCAYNLKGNEAGQAALLQIKTATHSARLQDQLETALEEERTREASTITEVAWLDRTVPVASPAVRVALSQSRGIEHEIAQGQLDDFDVMMSTYDRLFVQYGDALAALNTEMEREKKAAGAHLSEAAQERLAHLQFLRAYVLHQRLLQMVARNMRMVRRTVAAYEQKGEAQPEDLVRLYDILLQNMTDMAQIEILQDDPDFMDTSEAHTLYFKSMRAFYTAEYFRQASKPAQALALYERCVERANKAKTKLQKLRNDREAKSYLADLDKIAKAVRTQKCSMQAQTYLQSKDSSSSAGALQAPAAAEAKPVLATPMRYEADAAVLARPLLAFPPEFETVPCKPLFFDLAGNHISYPSFKDYKAQQAAAGKTAAAPKADAAPAAASAPKAAAAQPAKPAATPAEPAAAAPVASVTDAVTGVFKSLGGWWGGSDKK